MSKPKLSKEQIVTINVLCSHGSANAETARRLGVTEGAVRYHLRRKAAGAEDGRKRTCLVERLGLVEVVDAWWSRSVDDSSGGRPPSVESLHRFLVEEHGFEGSYKSVRKWVRGRFPAPKLRPYRRVETPPGAQGQADWAEEKVDIGDASGPTKLYAFVLELSHSRMAAVVWSRSMDQLSWHRCHNEALRRLGGVPAVIRIDNLKTGVSRGAGPWGEINGQYRSYAKAVGFHVDPHEARCPESKGKVERQVRVVHGLGASGLHFESLEHLQSWTDGRMEQSAGRRRCAATGRSVLESWQAERPRLGALPEHMPEPFDVIVERAVHQDCTVRFEGRSYSVPFAFCGRTVEVRGCAGSVQVVDGPTGRVIARHERGTEATLVIDPAHYEGVSTERVERPKPLGRMARRLQEIAEMPVERRPMDLYAALAEVAR